MSDLTEDDVTDIARDVAEEIVSAALDDNELVRDDIFASVAEQVTEAWDSDIIELRERIEYLEGIAGNLDFFKADRNHSHN